MMTISSFIKRLGIAVVVSHVGIVTGLHFYRKKRANDVQPLFKKRTEEEKLLSWLTQLKGVYLIKDIAANVQKLDSFKVRDDDVYIVSYPKSGTTWLSEIVYHIIHDMNFIKARSSPLDERVPYLEWIYTNNASLESMPSTHSRIIKSHLPLSLFPQQILDRKCKTIYIMRNPRDVCVSYYHFTKMIKPVEYKGDFTDFFQLFISGQVSYGSWAWHVKGFWDVSSRENVLFLTYEQLKKDPVDTIKRVAEFLGKSLSVEQQRLLAHSCSFTKMRSIPASNYDWLEKSDFKEKGVPFLRKGIVGDWQEYMDSDMVAILNCQVQTVNDSMLEALIEYNIT